MTKSKLFALATVTLSFAAFDAQAHNHHWKNKIGSNSLSSQPRDADSPGIVQVPPNGYPSSAMSAGGDMGGNGFAYRDRFDRTKDVTDANHKRFNRDWAEAEDVMIYREAAPEHVASTPVYDDVPALRAVDLSVALNQLHHINRMEIDQAKMVESRAKSPDVLNLAHQIRADHEKMEKNVVATANRRGISLERFQLSTSEKALNDGLAKLSTPDLEQAYIAVTDRCHQKAAADLRQMRNNLADSEVRGLINDALPQMAAHRHTDENVGRSRAATEEGDLGE